MAHKKMDNNARMALKEFKYEMSKELGINNSPINSKNNINKLSEGAKQQMGNNNKF